VELRDIEIFLALAEELHFGRTAERLHISQARVSQAIAKQERRIGAALFERTSRRVVLTSIGARLRDDLEAGYARIRDGLETAATMARGTQGRLTLGTMGALAHDITDVTGRFRSRYPACELRFREAQIGDPFRLLRSGDIDLALLWLPVREPDLTVGPVLRARPLVLMAGASHPLARRTSVSMEDLGDCIVLMPSGPVPDYWYEALVPTHTPAGRPVPRGPRVATWQEGLAAVAAGQFVTPVQAEAALYYRWPNLVYVPIQDAPLGEWALVWRTAGETALVRAFVRTAQDVLDEQAAASTPGGP
jgi:DNA-binding transcriptional LysR family regulator